MGFPAQTLSLTPYKNFFLLCRAFQPKLHLLQVGPVGVPNSPLWAFQPKLSDLQTYSLQEISQDFMFCLHMASLATTTVGFPAQAIFLLCRAFQPKLHLPQVVPVSVPNFLTSVTPYFWAFQPKLCSKTWNAQVHFFFHLPLSSPSQFLLFRGPHLA